MPQSEKQAPAPVEDETRASAGDVTRAMLEATRTHHMMKLRMFSAVLEVTSTLSTKRKSPCLSSSATSRSKSLSAVLRCVASRASRWCTWCFRSSTPATIEKTRTLLDRIEEQFPARRTHRVTSAINSFHFKRPLTRFKSNELSARRLGDVIVT